MGLQKFAFESQIGSYAASMLLKEKTIEKLQHKYSVILNSSQR